MATNIYGPNDVTSNFNEPSINWSEQNCYEVDSIPEPSETNDNSDTIDPPPPQPEEFLIDTEDF